MKLNARGQAAGNMDKLVDRAQQWIHMSHGKGKERQGVICWFLTSLCPVASQKVRVGLLSHPPGNACAHDSRMHVSQTTRDFCTFFLLPILAASLGILRTGRSHR